MIQSTKGFSTRRVLRAALACGLVGLPAVATHAVLVDATWDGGAGDTDYNNFLNWDINLVPFNGNNGDTYNIFIPGGFTVNPQGATTIQGLNIAALGNFHLSEGDSFRISADSVNDGDLLISDNGSGNATLQVNASLTLDGSGQLRFFTDQSNNIGTSSFGNIFTNGVGHTIKTVSGAVGAISVDTVNDGSIIADDGLININRPMTNNAVLQSRLGGTLNFASGVTITNNAVIGGSFAAVNPGSTINLNSNTINGGSISGAGTLELGGTHLFNGVSLDIASVNLDEANNLQLINGLTNNTVINFNDAGSGSAQIQINNTQTIDGVGQVHFSTDQTNQIGTSSFANILTIGAQQIVKTTGTDNTGAISVDTVNQGVIDADNGTININRPITNLGTLGSTGTGTLALTSGVSATIDPLSVFAATDAGATISLTSNAINGGSISGAGTLELSGTHTFDGVTLDIANVNLDENNNLQIVNGLTNNTAITFNDAGSGSAQLQINNTQAITGNGAIHFATNDANQINTSSFANILTLGAGQTLKTVGSGNSGSINVNTINNGVINADNGTINITRPMTNNNTLHATGNGTLALTSGVALTNNALFAATSPGSTISLTSNIINGGPISGNGTLELSGTHLFNGVTLDIANINLDAGNNLQLIGGLTNNTVMTFNDAGSGSAVLQVNESQTLNGSGEVHFSTNDANQINTNSLANVLTIGAGQTLKTVGSGNSGSINVNTINQGVINADDGTIAINRPMTNNNTLQATGNGTLALTGGVTLTNNALFAAADAGSSISMTSNIINGGSISGNGTLELAGTHSFNGVTLDIANVNLDAGNNLQIIGGLTNNTVIDINDAGGGSALLQINASQSITGSGEVWFNSPDTNTLSTNSFANVLTLGAGQTVRATAGNAGSITVDTVNNGRLIAEAGSTINLNRSFNNQGTIGGTGTINLSGLGLDNNGTISPGLSPGTLSINGDITNSDSSTLLIEIAGNQAGQFDLLNVGGSFEVDGELRVVFREGAESLSAGDSITIVNASSLIDTDPTIGFDSVGVDSAGTFDLFFDEIGGTITLSNFNGIIPLSDSFVLGDMNGDGALTNGDIAPFVQALTDVAGYAAAFPGLNPDLRGDFTGDNQLTNGDIAGFVSALTGGGGAAASLAAVPEPTTAALLFASLGLLGRRRRSA